MNDLIIGSLKKSGIDCHNRLQPPGGEGSGQAHSMLLGNAHIKKTLRIGLGKPAQAGTPSHRGS